DRHALEASSFPEKEQEVEQLRHRRLDVIHIGWIVLSLGALLLGYASLWVFLPARAVAIGHGIGGVVLVALIPLGALIFLKAYPGAQMQREAASEKFRSLDAVGQSRASGMAPAGRRGGMMNNMDRVEDAAVPGAVDPLQALGMVNRDSAPAAPRVRN